jgi:hypothetical protein
MICVFPDPYPDELLYSVCARYSALMDYPNKITATSDFFGGTGVAVVVDLPNRLNHLINALPPGHLYSVDELIYEHTHYPFYVPFLPRDRALLVRDTMRNDGNNRVAERIGISADRLKMPTYLRFCPPCVRQDKARFGETYWHRIHQVPGVEVCPHHATFLEESNTLWRNPRNPGEPFAAEHSINDTPARALDTSEHIQSIQVNIARQALWLLEWSTETVGGLTLGRRYHNLLLRMGLACYNGQVRTAQLTSNFLTFYSSEFLKSLGCNVRNHYSSWLMRLLNTHKAGVAQHPIRHILFLISIGSSAPEALDSFVEFKPFGDGPWPCLNHASGHFAEPRVHSCRVSDGEKKNSGKPVGTFSCACGFIYTRTGPDQLEADRSRWTSVRAYGAKWGNLLEQLWGDTSLTLRQVAQKLSVHELTVKRRAINLGLTFPRPTLGIPRPSKDIPDRYKIKQLAQRKPLKTNGRKPSLSPSKKKVARKTNINWEEQDSILSEEVRNAALQIRSATIPTRVSITAIVRLVGHRAWLEKKLDKLPLTSGMLATHLESFENYSVRRILWATDSFRNEGETPSRAMLSSRAKIRGRLFSNSERIQASLDSALAGLNAASIVERAKAGCCS